VLEAEPGAELVTGRQTLMLHTGTLHAIGAGTFVYEIEQPSDLTFRISDWGRPTGRQLHRAEALRAVDPSRHAVPAGRGFRLDGGALEVPQFRLELPDATAGAVRRDPGGRSLEIITTLRGELRLAGDGWTERLSRHETLVVPASAAAYTIEGGPGAIAAVGLLP
jgi:mannose-6-phosphate isomerase